MPDVVICEFMDEAAIRDGLAGLDVLYDAKLVDRPDDLKRAVVSARALIVRNRTQVRGDLLAAATNLKAVGRLGVGLDNIDQETCRTRGIAVFPATGANDVSVAEYVIATALVLLRQAYVSTFEVIAGRWPRERLISGREMSGKRLGLVGFGSIARETATRAAAMGMRVAAFDPYVKPDDPAWTQAWGEVQPLGLDDLLRTSDVVSLHVPLTPETRNLLDATKLRLCRRDAIVINAARGGVLDEAALAEALKEGRLGGAALDVFGTEPLPEESGRVFGGCPNLILTPHVAGVTQEANTRVSSLIADRIRTHLAKG